MDVISLESRALEEEATMQRNAQCMPTSARSLEITDRRDTSNAAEHPAQSLSDQYDSTGGDCYLGDLCD